MLGLLLILLLRCLIKIQNHLSRLVTKPTKWHVRPAKTQISLDIRSVWSESLLCAQWVAKDPMFLLADSEYSDQTRRMPRLIWIFAGRKGHFVGFVMRRLIFKVYPKHKPCTALCQFHRAKIQISIPGRWFGKRFYVLLTVFQSNAW